LSDALSGLPNRSAFVARLEKDLVAETGQTVGVLFIDLDDFKVVNDSLGHAAGDELLKAVADRLKSAVRQEGLVARLGGDEFAVVLDCGTDPTAAKVTADKALHSLSGSFRLGPSIVNVGCSIGVAVMKASLSADADELLRNADFAMYMAKSRGKNCVEVFVPTMHNDMLAGLELKNDLAMAIERNQLDLHYQPVFEISSSELLGFEALVRWRHPVRGLLLPAEFIGLAEETGDIVAIGDWVIAQACQDLVRLQTASGERPVRMSINVSASQLQSDAFVQTVAEMLDQYGIEADRLVVEITEGVAVSGSVPAAAVLAALRELGISVALDDFGMGYSSLRHLQELPIDIIKIDKSFVVNPDAKSRAMLEAMVEMGRSLGLGIVAEGIETADELERLRGLCPMAGQGFLLARPMPYAAALELAKAREPLERGATGLLV
jgi:diguanylate cyclase (GGDEF)-like protein